jgi:phage terminase large subunit-like protein
MARATWLLKARPSQITPQGSWRIWLILAGRGWGKTRTGAEDAAYHALWQKDSRIAVIAPTQADARDTCVEGASGLLKVIPPDCIDAWNRSMGELVLVNGSRFKLFSADEPERLRGPQFTRAWADELGAWKQAAAFDQVMMGLRLGESPQLVVTTTPRPVPLVKQLVGRAGADVFLTRGASEENENNLAPGILTAMRAQYGGTRWARQELDGDLVEDVEGALWNYAQLETLQVKELPPLARTVIAIDPAVTSNSKSDETGIVAAARGDDGKFYVLADASGQFTPDGWARRALALFEEWQADLIIGEVNEGGDLIERMLRMSTPYVPYKPVRALKAKAARAWPVAMLYERGLVRHAGSFAKLEEQMCRFTSDGLKSGSPDRVDALVWALTELQQGLGRDPRVRTLG